MARSAPPPAAARFVPTSCLWLQRVARRWCAGHFAFPVVNLMYICVSVWFGAQLARTAGAAGLRWGPGPGARVGAIAKRCVASSECGRPDAPTLQQMHRLHGPRGVCGATAMPLSPCRADASVRQCPACPPWHQQARRRPYAVLSGSLDPHHVCLQPPQGVLCTCKLRHARCFLSVSRRAPVSWVPVVVVWLCRGAIVQACHTPFGRNYPSPTARLAWSCNCR
jgi:hypothetical protein